MLQNDIPDTSVKTLVLGANPLPLELTISGRSSTNGGSASLLAARIRCKLNITSEAHFPEDFLLDFMLSVKYFLKVH